ncbi:hypothetical protein NLJ89_g4219 [Agrocybe chaxingu]|uniref:Chromo domain-containing protein n=1 Tax=Agrocybe chaxingu TaxID=84603 RepID=A0A9W8K3A0_9AGAR|nr:hypothetical protein NLJ89_g4219 [Agrocybe chaxingu]
MGAASRSESEDSTHPLPRKNAKADATTDDAQSGDDGSENGEEYEIEEVLDAKRGYFPDGRIGYFVKWKGYGPEDNSWVDENDAVKNAFRKSVDKKEKEKTASPKKPRKSVPADDSSDAGVVTTAKKRGRKPISQKVDSEDEMDVDQPETRAPKKARKNANAAASKASKKRSKSPEERALVSMEQYMHLEDWEGLVKSVDTVETLSGTLVAYFTLNSGEAAMEKTEICRERFPSKRQVKTSGVRRLF